ncbi:MAG: cell division protein FtsA [Armatimonadetes bacterium]|nr:cell division protein FtsA [Armatimonadota bacterium]
MSDSRLITGLDIGTTKICAVIAEASPGSAPEVIGVGISPCDGLKKGVVIDLESTTDAVRSAVDKAQRMAGEEVRSVVVGVTGEHIACLNSRSVIAITHSTREITDGDVERLLDTAKIIVLPADREIVHAIPRWYSVDGQDGVHAPVGMHGNRLEVETHIVTGMTSFIQNVMKCVRQAGCEVDGTVLEPIATSESVLSPAETELGVVLVDIGGGTSDVAIYVGGSIYYSGVVPVGGSHVTRDIAIGLRTSIEEAERLKVNFGSAHTLCEDQNEPFEFVSLSGERPRQLPRKVLAEIIEPRMVELLQMVREHVEKAGCADRVPAGIVLTGGGSLLRGLPELVEQAVGMAARVGSPTGVTGLVESVSSPACATAVGLVEFWARHERGNARDSEGEAVLPRVWRRLRDLLAGIGGD